MPGCNSEASKAWFCAPAQPMTIYEDMAELIRAGRLQGWHES